MSWKIGLHIGEGFAEATARSGSGAARVHSTLWHLSQSSPAKGLKQFLDQHQIPGDQVEIVATHKMVTQILQKRLGTTPAFLVTSGFESWLDMNLPVRPEHFSVRAEKQPSPIHRDLVFGISERMSATGEDLRPVDMADLEFLVSKLQLNQVSDVAIGFVHGASHPQHENQAATFLTEKGFRVHTSGANPASEKGERPRWWAALLDAYVTSALGNMEEAVQQQITEQVAPRSFQWYRAPQGEGKLSALATNFSSWRALQSHLRAHDCRHLLYLGLEDFAFVGSEDQDQKLWCSDWGLVACSVPQVDFTEPQPDRRWSRGFWGNAELEAKRPGFEPGPMALGKGLHATFFDLLYVVGRLQKIEVLQGRLVDRSRSRILESLASMTDSENVSADFQALADHLFESAMSQLVTQWEIHCGRSPVLIAGPLSEVLLPSMRPHLPGTLVKTMEQSQTPISWALSEVM